MTTKDSLGFLRAWVSTRRNFLTGLAAGATFPAELLRHRGDPEDLAGAQRLFGLSFTAEDLAAAVGRVDRARDGYSAVRAREIDWWTAPAWQFDPLVPGVAAPAPGPRPTFAIPPATKVLAGADLAYASVAELAGLLRAGKATSRQLTEACLTRLETLDPKLLCVVTLLRKQALAAADRADKEIAAGKWRSPLHGIPYGAKDLFAWPGAPTTFGAAPFRDQVLPGKAAVLERLEAAGAILVAKLSLGALAMGDVWYRGRTRNPWNPAQGSSGSSAGPAAAVAAGLVPFAIGTETCGSILSPCARCGVSGLRPSFGLVSRAGAMPLSWSMDKVGPIARHAEDLAMVFDTIRGSDGKDAMMRDVGFAWDGTATLRGMRIGHLGGERRGPRRKSDQTFVEWLGRQGATVVPARLPEAPYSALMQILSVEAATAFDDLTRSPDLAKLTRQDPASWPQTFRAARFVPAVEFLRATRVRAQLMVAMHELLRPFDALISSGSGATLYATNLSGHPAVIFPHGDGRDGRGPATISLVGKLYGETAILRIATAWQRQTGFHLGRPS